MKHPEPTRFAATMALLRGLLILIAGIFALFAPAMALTVLVVVGGILLIAEGVLGLASHDFGVDRDWPFWLGLTRSVLAIVAGLALLFSPYLATMITLGILATIVGLQAVVIGLIEIVFVVRNRKQYEALWRPLAGAMLYLALGLLLLFSPFAAALLLVQIGGALLVAFAALQLSRTWTVMRNATGMHPSP